MLYAFTSIIMYMQIFVNTDIPSKNWQIQVCYWDFVKCPLHLFQLGFVRRSYVSQSKIKLHYITFFVNNIHISIVIFIITSVPPSYAWTTSFFIWIYRGLVDHNYNIIDL